VWKTLLKNSFLITDIAGFLLPYVTGIDSIYTQYFSANHQTLAQLFNTDMGNHFVLLLGYALNTLGIIYIMLLPGVIWFFIYSRIMNYDFDLPDISLNLFYLFVPVLLLMPVFKIKRFSKQDFLATSLSGVDIQTQSVLTSNISVAVIVLIALSLFIIIYFLKKIKTARNILILIMVFTNILFFGSYIYNYYISVLNIYVELIKSIILMNTFIGTNLSIINSLGGFYLACFNIIFLIITTVFYFTGFVSYVIYIIRYVRNP